jgi:hypothetical protein
VVSEATVTDATLQKSLINILCGIFDIKCVAKDAIKVSPSYRDHISEALKGKASPATVVVHLDSTGNCEVTLEETSSVPFVASYEVSVGDEAPVKLSSGWISAGHLRRVLFKKMKSIRSENL